MKLWVNSDCDGFAKCTAIAPEVFSTPAEPDFRTDLLVAEIDEDADDTLAGRVVTAIQTCPKRAIRTDLDIAF